MNKSVGWGVHCKDPQLRGMSILESSRAILLGGEIRIGANTVKGFIRLAHLEGTVKVPCLCIPCLCFTLLCDSANQHGPWLVGNKVSVLTYD